MNIIFDKWPEKELYFQYLFVNIIIFLYNFNKFSYYTIHNSLQVGNKILNKFVL